MNKHKCKNPNCNKQIVWTDMDQRFSEFEEVTGILYAPVSNARGEVKFNGVMQAVGVIDLVSDGNPELGIYCPGCHEHRRKEKKEKEAKHAIRLL